MVLLRKSRRITHRNHEQRAKATPDTDVKAQRPLAQPRFDLCGLEVLSAVSRKHVEPVYLLFGSVLVVSNRDG